MRTKLLMIAVLAVMVVIAGCTGGFANGDGNNPSTSKTSAQESAELPLQGTEIWVAGTLVTANGSVVVLETAEKQLALNATHGVFFKADGGPQEWTSVDNWNQKDSGVSVCISVHVHPDDEIHIIKAFYNSTCTPLAKQ